MNGTIKYLINFVAFSFLWQYFGSWFMAVIILCILNVVYSALFE